MALHQVVERRTAVFDQEREAPQPPRSAARAGQNGRNGRNLVRRRQILLGLGALIGIAVIAAMGSGAAGAWWAVFAVVVAAGAYLALLHHARAVAAEREFTAILGPSISDLRALSHRDLTPEAGEGALDLTGVEPHPPNAARQAWALICFAVANLGGWLLSPLVFALTLIIGEKPQDTTGQRWLANLQAAQQRLREQSLRTLAVSAATTASVTAAGTVGFLGAAGVSPAAAAPLATMASSATLTTGVALPAAVTTHATYRVVPGDDLFLIAQRFGTTVAALASANHIANPNFIMAGQVLTITGATSGRVSGPTTSGSSGAGSDTYTVRAGDTLGAIAARFGTTVSVLAATNNIANPNLILPGEVLVVRGHLASAPAPAPPVSHPTAPPVTRRSAPVTAPATSAQIAVRTAEAQIGKPYQWAGAGPASFDCSGLVKYAWAAAGVYLPHYSVSQYQDTIRISESQLLPGDLVFYDTGGGAQPGHVTIYIGGGQVITADSPGTFIKIVPLTWDGPPMGFGRVR